MAEWPNAEYLWEEIRALSDDITIRNPIALISDHVRRARGKLPTYYFGGSELEAPTNEMLRRPGGKPSFYEQEKKETLEQSLKSGEDVAPSVVPSFPKFRQASELNEGATTKVEEGTAVKLTREIIGKTHIDNDFISGSFNIKCLAAFPALKKK